MEQFVDNEAAYNAWVEDYAWVGIVYPQDVHEAVTFITPLASYDQHDGWQTITEKERSEYFPNNGKVARFTRDFPPRKVNRLYQFQPELNQQSSIAENKTTYARFLTHSDPFLTLEPLAQVFDWTTRAHNFFAIVDLLSQGLPVGDCLSHTIFIQYQDKIYGPIHLEPGHHDPQTLKPREYNQRSNPGGQPLLLNGFSFAADKMITIAKQMFLDQKKLGSPRHQTDWSLPQTTIKRALRASKSVSDDLQKKVLLVDRQISELAALSAASGPEALRIEECIIQRAQYIVKHQIKRLDGLQTLIEEFPAEHPLLVQASILEIQQRKQEIEQDCEAEQENLQRLQKESQTAQANLTRLNSEIEEAEQQQEQMHADLVAQEDSLHERMAGLREEMLHLLTELQFTSALPLIHTHIDAGEMASEINQSATTIHQRSHFITEKVTTLADPQDFYWSEIALQHRVSAEQVKTCAAALLAGLLPVVSQPSLLQAVAQGIAGQRIWCVPVPLTAIDPLALFGHISGERQVFVPVAGELADILMEAQDHPDQLGLIVLEGIDRVPFLPVIEPVLRHYRAIRQHIQQIGKATPDQETLQLFHPRALVPEDPYQKISRLAWPANLLLAVTVDESIGSFPLPETSASWFASIERYGTNERTQGYWSGERKNWQVPAPSWYAWEKESSRKITHQNDRTLLADFEPWQQVFYIAMEFLGMKGALREIIEQLWP